MKETLSRSYRRLTPRTIFRFEAFLQYPLQLCWVEGGTVIKSDFTKNFMTKKYQSEVHFHRLQAVKSPNGVNYCVKINSPQLKLCKSYSHEQMNDPLVLLHRSSAMQLCVPSLHSSTSER